LLSAFYSAGLAVPFLVTGLGINKFLAFYGRFREHLHKVEVVSGVILIAVGLLVASGYSTLLASSRLAGILPNAEGWIKVKSDASVQGPAPVKTNYETAPQVQFQTLAGKPFTLGELRGKVVLLNLWATWCIPCREEIPVLNAMQQDLAGQGLKIVGASLEDTAAGIEEYQRDVAKFQYDVVVGGNDAKSQLGGTPLPTTYLIDREGRVRQKIIGARDRAGWEAAVKPLLEEVTATAMISN
jgi:thiol-disulfide isomerase/thioredoxin